MGTTLVLTVSQIYPQLGNWELHQIASPVGPDAGRPQAAHNLRHARNRSFEKLPACQHVWDIGAVKRIATDMRSRTSSRAGECRRHSPTPSTTVSVKEWHSVS
jgi:hypothetical protein